MVATLAVPVPGLPVVPQLALAASAGGEAMVVSLILPPWTLEEEEDALVASADYQSDKARLLSELAPSRRSKDYLRQLHSLTRA